MAEHGDAVGGEGAGTALREQLAHGGCVGELVDNEGGVGGAGEFIPGGAVEDGGVVEHGVAVGVDEDVGVEGMVDGDDGEALAGDGGGEDVVVEAGDAVAGGEEQDAVGIWGGASSFLGTVRTHG